MSHCDAWGLWVKRVGDNALLGWPRVAQTSLCDVCDSGNPLADVGLSRDASVVQDSRVADIE
jgi:hypothetical protein